MHELVRMVSDCSVISKHIKNIYIEGELEEESICAKNAHIPQKRNRLYVKIMFNLDVIISVDIVLNHKKNYFYKMGK